ncbi:hypothetical protein ACWD4L_38670 [Streptomyces sp. NPDC002596]
MTRMKTLKTGSTNLTKDIEAPPGEAELIARAWDSTAAVQAESPATVWNPRGYANNAAAHLHITCRP